MKLERQAYEESMRARFELAGLAGLNAMREQILSRFSTAAYAWMWPFAEDNARWFDLNARLIAAGSRPSGTWARYRPEHP